MYDIEFVLRPITWLRGSDDAKTIRVGVSDGEGRNFLEWKAGGVAPKNAVFFLVRTPRRPDDPRFEHSWPHSPYATWLLITDPYGIRDGLVAEAGDGSTALADVKKELARQSLSSLAAASDVVLLGHLTPGAIQKYEIGKYFSYSADVDSVISGDPGSRTITIRMPTPGGELSDRSALLFLSRGTDGVYEFVVPGGACLRVRDNRIVLLDTPLGAAVQEIRAAKAQQRP